jgi:DNA adenine methylase
MQYNGGKARIARELAAVISSFKPKVYWEPFVGAANVIQLVEAPVRIGSDIDPHIISYLQCIQAGWLPPSEISKEDYYAWKQKVTSTREEFATKAAIGYGASFSGKWFGGYQYGPGSAVGNVRNSAIKQSPRLQKIQFKLTSFLEFLPQGVNLIYADPPYRGTTKCGSFNYFNSDFFWAWALACSLTGIRVLVSEFLAPSFATEIWSKEKYTDLRRSDGQTVMTERLYLVGSL